MKRTPEERFWSKVDKNGPTMAHMSTPCWVWKGATFDHGYGDCKSSGDGTTRRAHRSAWIMAGMPAPCALFVCHKCDNPPCVRPDHLFLGTTADNMQDMVNKGRQATADRNGSYTHPERRPTGDRNGSRLHPEKRPRGATHEMVRRPELVMRGDDHWTKRRPELILRGEANPRAKLCDADVKEIRAQHASGTSQRELSRRFSIDRTVIRGIVTGELWAHVE